MNSDSAVKAWGGAETRGRGTKEGGDGGHLILSKNASAITWGVV